MLLGDFARNYIVKSPHLVCFFLENIDYILLVLVLTLTPLSLPNRHAFILYYLLSVLYNATYLLFGQETYYSEFIDKTFF